MDWRSKIFTNKKMTDEEFLVVQSVFEDDTFNTLLKTHFMYVFFDDKGYIRFLSIDNKSVQNICEDFSFSKKEAVEYIYMKDQIDQDLAELLYWAGIDNYKKYVPVINIQKNGERMYADYYLFAKNEIDANEYLYRNGYFDYMYLEDVDA
jgi:hypothetical protein